MEELTKPLLNFLDGTPDKRKKWIKKVLSHPEPELMMGAAGMIYPLATPREKEFIRDKMGHDQAESIVEFSATFYRFFFREVLAEFVPGETDRILLEALRSPDPHARGEAAKAFAENKAYPNLKILHALTLLLGEGEKEVRDSAAAALKNAHEEGFSLFLSAFHSGETRAARSIALGVSKENSASLLMYLCMCSEHFGIHPRELPRAVLLELSDSSKINGWDFTEAARPALQLFRSRGKSSSWFANGLSRKEAFSRIKKMFGDSVAKKQIPSKRIPNSIAPPPRKNRARY
ncbi:hypothetical protein GF415_04620 [Candidatus Micrarchaeota archaeon]|nr:hypothetical protein [Candidatus Micrarchaeota archaeon]